MSWIDFIQGMYFWRCKNDDTEYMKLAINWQKGAVYQSSIVWGSNCKDNRIIGQGYHEIFGGLHCREKYVKIGESTTETTLYVTLEPCCHYGKTCCTEAIIKSGITR